MNMGKMSCFSIGRREIKVRGDRNFLNTAMAQVVMKIPTRIMHLCCIRFVSKGIITDRVSRIF